MAKPKSRKTVRAGKPAPCPDADVDTAAIALSQAHGILDMLTVACAAVQAELTDTYNGSLSQSIYAAMSEVDRAHVALLGYPVTERGTNHG